MKKQNLKLKDMTMVGYQGVICVEAGGPTPGLGCAGRGIITALEKLKETGRMKPINRTLFFMTYWGCCLRGLFHAHAKRICGQSFIITSGENMAIHAGANIAMAVQNFRNRGYAALGGIILNRRNVKREEEKYRNLRKILKQR